jgi:O-antigen/teichoic acid export membrane protein
MLVGRLSMTAANAVLMLLAALVFMGDATFGTFAACVGVQIALSRGVLLGLDQSVVRLHTAAQDRTEPVQAAVSIAGGIGVVVLAVGLPLAMFEPFGISWVLIASAVVGAVGSAWFDLGCAVVLARLRYRAAGLLTAAMPAVRLCATVGAFVLTPDDSVLPSVAFAGATFAAGVILFGAVIRRFGWHAGREMFWRELHYSKWVGMSDAAMVLSTNMGLFLLKARGLEAAAGRFAFGLQIAQGLMAVFLAFYQSLLPRAARLSSVDSLPAFLRQGFATATRLAVASAVIAALCALGLPMMLESIRPELVDFAPGFLGVSAFVIVLMFEAPLGVTCQFLMRPKLQLLGLCTRAAAIGGLGLWLVPAQEDVGAGLAQTLGSLCGALALVWLVLNAVDEERKARACAAS